MTDTLTPYLGLTKPEVGDPAGEDLWGEKLNANFDKLDEFLQTSGGVSEAPTDGNPYSRQSNAWVVAPELSDVNAIAAKNTEQDTRLDTIETKNTTQDTRLTAVEAKNTAQDGRLDAIETNNTAQDTAIAGKEPTIAPGNVSYFWAGDKTWKPVPAAGEPIITPGTAAQYWRGDKTWQTLDKVAVGLGNVDNTSDVNKPVSTATQTALNGKEPTIAAGVSGQYWDGTKTWKALPPQTGLVTVQDTPPSSPTDGQQWFESDSGKMYLRYNDGVGASQWIQTNGSNFPTPPNDNGEYVFVNGVWRLKHQTLIFDGQTQVDVTVPSGARRVCWNGNYVAANTTLQGMGLRLSLDGSTFAAGASDYTFAGYSHYTGTSGGSAVTNLAPTTASYGVVSLDTNAGSTFFTTINGALVLTRPNTSHFFYGQGHSLTYRTETTIAYTNADLHYWLGATPSGSALAVQKLRFLNDVGIAFTSGLLHLDWGY